MAVSADWYNRAVARQTAGAEPVDWESDTIKVALLETTHTPDLDGHEFFDDVSADEVTAGGGNNYTAGGATLGTKSVNRSTVRTSLRAANTVWTPDPEVSLAAGYAVIYKDTSDPETSPLIGIVNFDGELTATGAAFTIDWDDTDGVLYIDRT